MKKNKFNQFPEVIVRNIKGYLGWSMITSEIIQSITTGTRTVICIECYHGVYIDEIELAFTGVPGISAIINSTDAFLPEKVINEKVHPYVTDDPVFGYITSLQMADLFSRQCIETMHQEMASVKEGIILVIGPGASLIAPDADLLVYADMPRWEIQHRFKAYKTANLGAQNYLASFNYKYKRAFFVDWRVCDKLKEAQMDKWDYVLDTTIPRMPKMITGDSFRKALEQTYSGPFRLVPYFDPGPWGGQWLKESFDLESDAPNIAWGFDCVPEENSLLFRFDNLLFETPALNLVFHQPAALLGEKVYEAFGAEFPIRFDFLDTMDGGNLSLQVHPLKSYIRDKFGMAYTQDESYYFLQAKQGSTVYLGLKEQVVPEKMLAALEAAQEKGGTFDADAYVEKWEVKQHDHVLIPAGTIHCSGANNVVLEISATPYIFTFKLWDWGRLGLNGKPRPISLEHGKNSIQWNRTASWTSNNIINQIELVAQGDGWREERTGLHEESFIETRRHWFNKKVTHVTNGSVNILNLVEGDKVVVESPTGAFAPFIIHYAETFIVPAAVQSYTIRPYDDQPTKEYATIKASVRTENLTDYRIN